MSRQAAAKDVYYAIADPTRRAILDHLGRGEQPVMELAGRFDISLSAVSQHMRVLREVGLVQVRRVGRERHYRLNAHPLREVADWTAGYERFWSDKLTALAEHLEKEQQR
jgi:DNA-binding transcriptional ArsR family regulator